MLRLKDDRGVFNLPMVILTIALTFIALSLAFINSPYLLKIDFKWFQTLAFFIVALIAQMFFKLNDTKDLTKVTESEFNNIKDDINDRVSRLLKVLLFYFLSAVILSAIHGTIASLLGEKNRILTIEEINFIKRFYLLSLSYVVAWLFSVWNAYTLYIEISELKSEIAQGEIDKEGRKKAVERLIGKAK